MFTLHKYREYSIIHWKLDECQNIDWHPVLFIGKQNRRNIIQYILSLNIFCSYYKQQTRMLELKCFAY